MSRFRWRGGSREAWEHCLGSPWVANRLHTLVEDKGPQAGARRRSLRSCGPRSGLWSSVGFTFTVRGIGPRVVPWRPRAVRPAGRPDLEIAVWLPRPY